MLAIRIVTDVEILDCSGQNQSPYEARPAPVVDRITGVIERKTRNAARGIGLTL